MMESRDIYAICPLVPVRLNDLPEYYFVSEIPLVQNNEWK